MSKKQKQIVGAIGGGCGVILSQIILHFITKIDNPIVSSIVAAAIGGIIGVIAALFLISPLKHQPKAEQKQ